MTPDPSDPVYATPFGPGPSPACRLIFRCVKIINSGQTVALLIVCSAFFLKLGGHLGQARVQWIGFQCPDRARCRPQARPEMGPGRAPFRVGLGAGTGLGPGTGT